MIWSCAAPSDPCIEGRLADVDPDTAGNQFDCSVSDVTNAHKQNQSETVLPACIDEGGRYTNMPCWRITTDEMNCTTNPDHYVLKIERSAAPPPETTIFANCVTEAI